MYFKKVSNRIWAIFAQYHINCMTSLARFLTNEQGERIAAQVPIGVYNKMLEQIEELEAIKTFDKAMGKKLVFEPFEQAMTEIRNKRK